MTQPQGPGALPGPDQRLMEAIDHYDYWRDEADAQEGDRRELRGYALRDLNSAGYPTPGSRPEEEDFLACLDLARKLANNSLKPHEREALREQWADDKELLGYLALTEKLVNGSLKPAEREALRDENGRLKKLKQLEAVPNDRILAYAAELEQRLVGPRRNELRQVFDWLYQDGSEQATVAPPRRPAARPEAPPQRTGRSVRGVAMVAAMALAAGVVIGVKFDPQDNETTTGTTTTTLGPSTTATLSSSTTSPPPTEAPMPGERPVPPDLGAGEFHYHNDAELQQLTESLLAKAASAEQTFEFSKVANDRHVPNLKYYLPAVAWGRSRLRTDRSIFGERWGTPNACDGQTNPATPRQNAEAAADLLLNLAKEFNLDPNKLVPTTVGRLLYAFEHSDDPELNPDRYVEDPVIMNRIQEVGDRMAYPYARHCNGEVVEDKTGVREEPEHMGSLLAFFLLAGSDPQQSNKDDGLIPS